MKATLFSRAATCLLSAALLSGCGAEDASTPIASNAQRPSFEEFAQRVYHEPWEGGVYVYDVDSTAATLEELRDAYERAYPKAGALVVNRVSNRDDIWSSSQKLNLRYCVSNSFGTLKAQVVNALAVASAAWEQDSQVDFIYVSSQDSSCTASNNSVTFDVRPVVGATYLARAFYPSYTRSNRSLLIDSNAFTSSYSLTGLLSHELGHTLGFKHEHTRPEGPASCFEDNNWRALTDYDSGSIMNWPSCKGTTSYAGLTTSDREGSTMMYGSKSWPPPLAASGCGLIPSGRGLGSNKSMYSCNGRFRLWMQGDGHLVLYQGTTPLWGSGTVSKPGIGAYMQTDGHLVIYTGLGRAIWGTYTWGNVGAYLRVQDDGNLVIYRPDGTPVWASNTFGR